MKPGPSVIADILFATHPIDAPPVSLIEIMSDVIIAQGWESSRSAARERAEAWQKSTLVRLRTEVNRLIEAGRPPRIAFNSSSDYMVQGACFVEPRDSPVLAESKKRRTRFGQYQSVIQQITPREFEILCGKVIGLLGVEKPTVTRSTADEGIDFYGRLSFGSVFFPHDLTPTIQKQLSIWLVGQAKHYQNVQSGTSEVRDLVGAIALGRVHAFGSTESPFKDLEIRPADAVFALLVTTGTISANAWRLLDRSGVIGMDGEMLAAFLADREAGIDQANFDRDLFIRWLNS